MKNWAWRVENIAPGEWRLHIGMPYWFSALLVFAALAVLAWLCWHWKWHLEPVVGA